MTQSELPSFDHVAIAVRDIESARAFLEEDLGVHPLAGGEAPGFRSHQWRFANGAKLELLEPFRQDESDFLERFLETSGPGAHHLTFRVAEIHESAEVARQAGFPILYVRDSEPKWKEAFIHPRDGLGTLVQLAEFPDRPGSVVAGGGIALDWVDVMVPDLDRARALYEGVFGGMARDVGTDAVTVSWSATGSIRLRLADEGMPYGIRGLNLTGGPPPVPANLSRAGLGVEMQLT